MGLAIHQVDAFTARPFSGNPAAVMLLPEPRDERWMQLVAREMNLSETAFLVRRDGGYDLRWFPPAVEVELCGHATLASAHVLWETGELPADQPARFFTRSGVLTAERQGGRIVLDFPATPAEAAEPPRGLVEAVGISPVRVGRNRFDYLLEVEGDAAVRQARPDFGALGLVEARGVIVTSRSASPEFDFVSRFFAPRVGVNEDPVTGSAHCALGPYWSASLEKRELVGFQASARGGVVGVEVRGERVLLKGQAVTVWRGELLEPDSR
ncbi:MAG: PhzF family phenazine biosynthesis protein [Planctomycetes bacterium]|nr:PhzF family phenazine biosynthesis protein [Planctomycetota bacterium]